MPLPTRRTPTCLKAGAALMSLVAVTALAGCGADAPEQGPAGFGSISVQYSWIKDAEFAGEYYAEDKGYYRTAGFEAVNGISGPDNGVDKLLSGKVQVAISDAASVGSAIAEQDAPLKIIAATFQRNPFTILSLRNGANITTPADLKGKRIGVRDADAAVFKAMLAANHLVPKRDKITVVPVDSDPTPLVKRQIDGYLGSVTNEALALQLAGHPVASLPYADNGVPYVAEAYTVTDSYLKQNKDLLKALLIAEIKGWKQTFESSSAADVKVVTDHFDRAAADKDGVEAGFGVLDPRRTAAGLVAEQNLISTSETEANGLLTVSPQLQQQTVQSLAAAGWPVGAEDLFDTSIIDSIYREHPELKR